MKQTHLAQAQQQWQQDNHCRLLLTGRACLTFPWLRVFLEKFLEAAQTQGSIEVKCAGQEEHQYIIFGEENLRVHLGLVALIM